MPDAPPAALLRARTADIIRLCGLNAAARGMELAAHAAVSGTRRAHARLSATVRDETAHAAWVEVTANIAPAATPWGCDCADEPHAPLACAHVAAVLAAWVAHPADFAVAPSRDTRPSVEPPHPPQQASTPSAPSPLPPSPSAGGHSLEAELGRLSATTVLAIARCALGVGREDGAADLVTDDMDEREARRALRDALADTERVGALVARLDADVRELLAIVALHGGAMTGGDLDAVALRSERPPSALRSMMAVLERYALVFPTLPAEGRRLAGWRIAPEVRAALPPLWPLSPMSPIVAPGAGLREASARGRPRIERGSPRALALALAALARLPAPVGLAPADDAVLQSSSVRDRGALRLLLRDDLSRERVAEVARGAGMEPGVLALARWVLLWTRERQPGHPAGDLAAVPPGERAGVLRAAFHDWLATEAAAELVDLAGPALRVRFETSHPGFRPAAVGQEVAAARRFVAKLVRQADPGAWYTTDDLLALIWRAHPLFLRERQQTFASPAWWLERGNSRHPLRPLIREEWLAGEGAFVRALLAGPLHYWGVVDIAWDENAPVAFRVTLWGRYLLAREGTADAAQPPGDAAPLGGDWGPPLLVTRDELLAVSPFAAGAPLMNALEVWARPQSITGGRLLYAPSADRACAAFDAGADERAVIARVRAMDARAGAVLEARLAAWRARYAQTRLVSGMALLEARDEASLLEALSALPAEVAAAVRRLGPGLALVPMEQLDRLREALARRGFGV